MSEPCPLLPISALDTRGVQYTDEDPPTGLVSRIQQALRQLSATDETGQPVEVTGQYDERTAHVLHTWLARDASRWPDPRIVEAAGGAWVTDCRVYRALGLDCSGVFAVDGVTPNAPRIRAEAERGILSLTCPSAPAPTRRVPLWQAIAGTLAVVVGLPWLGSRSR